MAADAWAQWTWLYAGSCVDGQRHRSCHGHEEDWLCPGCRARKGAATHVRLTAGGADMREQEIALVSVAGRGPVGVGPRIPRLRLHPRNEWGEQGALMSTTLGFAQLGDRGLQRQEPGPSYA